MKCISLITNQETIRDILLVVSENGDPDAILLTAKEVCRKLVGSNIDLFMGPLEENVSEAQ